LTGDFVLGLVDDSIGSFSDLLDLLEVLHSLWKAGKKWKSRERSERRGWRTTTKLERRGGGLGGDQEWLLRLRNRLCYLYFVKEKKIILWTLKHNKRNVYIVY